ncbi:MAG: hypothetical protein LC104_01350 [Bacteroidales bacterium]|nr:hypothetical protein [Bacteroidales bacterium]
MKRVLASWLGVVVVTAVSAGPDSPPFPTAAEQLQMLQSNRSLLEQLLDRSVAISDSESSLTRAEACRSAAQTLTRALQDATPATEPGRVAELADHLSTLWTEGLAPILHETRQEVHPGSPDYERLERLEHATTTDIQNATAALESAPAAVREQIQSASHRLQRLP